MSHDDRIRWQESYAGAPCRPRSAPAPFLVEHIALLAPGRTLDLAAGSGRNATFLAANRHRVLAVDVARSGLEALAGRPGIDLVQADLDRPCLRRQSFDNVVCVNFLDRGLFAEIATWLKPNGVLLLDTFLIDQRDFGHPRNPAFLLAHNELLERLRSWRVLRYREGRVEDSSGVAYRAGEIGRAHV